MKGRFNRLIDTLDFSYVFDRLRDKIYGVKPVQSFLENDIDLVDPRDGKIIFRVLNGKFRGFAKDL